MNSNNRRKKFLNVSNRQRYRLIAQEIKLLENVKSLLLHSINSTNTKINTTQFQCDKSSQNFEEMSISHDIEIQCEKSSQNFQEMSSSSHYFSIDQHTTENSCNDSDSSTLFSDDEVPFVQIETNMCLNESISKWAIQFNIKQNALSALLKILKKDGNNDLPIDGRTLLKTPRLVDIMPMCGGAYVHLGFKKAIDNILNELNNSNIYVSELNLLINIDGLPLSKSSTSCLWPILCSSSQSDKVYLVGAYHGYGKPKDSNTFMEKFINEPCEVINSGVLTKNGVWCSVKISSLICDAPAKSFVLNIKGHNGYFSCTKCNNEGAYVLNRVCFSTTACELRTDEAVAQMTDEDHHISPTDWVRIPHFGMVSSVPLDYMHLICLGIMKKLLNLWLSGPLNVRIPAHGANTISTGLLNLRKYIPNDFVRKPRGLNELKNWKATELRQFLLYSGPVVLKNIIEKNLYEHFLTLHAAVTILINPDECRRKNKYAKDLLQHFVHSSKILYGEQFISHNVHGLLHISDDVALHGALDNFSAFRYENYMQCIKNMLRKSEKPLEQIARRYHERVLNNAKYVTNLKIPQIFVNKEHTNGPLVNNLENAVQYKIYKYGNVNIDCDDRSNNTCLTNNGEFITIKNIIYYHGSYFVGYQHLFFKNLDKLSIAPMIGIYTESSCLQKWAASSILKKVWRIPIDNKYILIPLVHELENCTYN